MPREWPADEDLAQFIKESGEHKRAWALIAGLSHALQNERAGHPRIDKDSPFLENYVNQIKELETKVISQKAVLRNLEGVRDYERETERLLVEAMVRIGQGRPADGPHIAVRALTVNHARKGPRPDGS